MYALCTDCSPVRLTTKNWCVKHPSRGLDAHKSLPDKQEISFLQIRRMIVEDALAY